MSKSEAVYYNSGQRVKELLEAAESLLQLTDSMQVSVRREEWEQFGELTLQREELFERFFKIKGELDELNSNGALADADLSKLRDVLPAVIEKVTKVNQEIYDTIIERKQELSQLMEDAQQGLVFLKRVSNRINQSRVISRIL
jgi:uncharacterized coiled-coil DUF342 family protein